MSKQITPDGQTHGVQDQREGDPLRALAECEAAALEVAQAIDRGSCSEPTCLKCAAGAAANRLRAMLAESTRVVSAHIAALDLRRRQLETANSEIAEAHEQAIADAEDWHASRRLAEAEADAERNRQAWLAELRAKHETEELLRAAEAKLAEAVGLIREWAEARWRSSERSQS